MRALFSFQMSSSSPSVALAGSDGTTSYREGGYTLNVAWADGAVVSANIDGAADGSDEGSVAVAGPAALHREPRRERHRARSVGRHRRQLHGAVDGLVDETSGLLANEMAALEGQNELGQERVERLEERIERERERLLERFVAMETALTTMNRLLDSLRQQIESAFNNDD